MSEWGLSEEDAKTLFSTIDLKQIGDNAQYLKCLVEVMRYEGYNLRSIIVQMLEHHKVTSAQIAADSAAEKIVESEIKVDEVPRVWKFSNNSFKEDIEFLCVMFLTKGAAFDKIMKNSSEFKKDCMKTKYGINTAKRRPGVTLDAKTITTPRIAASFPSITVGLFHSSYGRSIVDPAMLFPDQDLPRVMFSPMMESVISHTNAPHVILLSIAVTTDDILHQMDKTSLNNLYNYYWASYNSTATTELVRRRHCSIWGVIIQHLILLSKY